MRERLHNDRDGMVGQHEVPSRSDMNWRSAIRDRAIHSLSPSRPETDDVAALAARFDTLHERVRGHAFETRRRVLALRSIATSAIDKTDAIQPCARNAAIAADPMQHRLVATDPPTHCPVFSRASSVEAGTPLTGPALIDATDTTIWLPPGWSCEVAPDQTLILTAMDQS